MNLNALEFEGALSNYFQFLLMLVIERRFWMNHKGLQQCILEILLGIMIKLLNHKHTSEMV